MGVKLIISFPSKDQASFGIEFDPGRFIVTSLSFVRSGAQQASNGRMAEMECIGFLSSLPEIRSHLLVISHSFGHSYQNYM